MSTFLKEFKFEKTPSKITYLEEEPLKLSNEYTFFHNKSKFRKELNRLQYLIKSYTKIPLHAAGIRDSYLKQEYFEDYYIVLFTTSEIVKNCNGIIDAISNKVLNPGCYYLKTTSDYMLLLSRDVEAVIFGIETMEKILKQVLEDYINQKKYDDYIKVGSFELHDCIKSN
jgi:hypothetical protein